MIAFKKGDKVVRDLSYREDWPWLKACGRADISKDNIFTVDYQKGSHLFLCEMPETFGSYKFQLSLQEIRMEDFL